MYRLFFFAISFFCTLLPLSANPAGVKFIIPAEERDDLPKIKSSSSNIRVEPFTGDEEFQPLPEESFAAVLGMPEEHTRWVPEMEPGMIHKMRITGSDSCFDGSILLLAEKIGERDGPYGTRILLYSTTNLVILRMIELPCLAKEIRCEGSSGRVWFLRVPQPDTLKDTPALCILNAKSGKIEKEIPLKTLPDRMYPHITGKFAWLFHNGKISRIFPDGKELTFLEVPNAKDAVFSNDRKYFSVFTDDGTKLFSTQSARHFGTYQYLPGNTFLFLGGDPPAVLIGKNETGLPMDWPESVYYCSGKHQTRLLTDNLSGPITPDPSGTIIYALKPKNRLEKINAENGKVMGFAHYRSIKPLVKGSILYLFPLNEKDRFLIFDSAGGISKIDTSKKRWKRVGSMRPWTE